MEYLEFEKPIQELDEQVEKCWGIGNESNIDVKETCGKLEEKRDKAIEDLFKTITPWQRVQLSRHPNRPYTLDYIKNLTDGNYIELHGDRNYGDDRAMIGAMGEINGKPYMFIGQQKGRNTKERQLHNFGMPNPEGYRKALRLMKLAEKFNIPIVTLIDTPGAYPGIEAEERGQGEAIARNIYEMCNINVPIICIIIGEGASGGALGIGVGDQIYMLENTWYSVISPESCSSILWRSWEYKEQAAEALNLTAQDMYGLELVDGIIEEPLGGAHRDPEGTYKAVRSTIVKAAANLRKMNPENRLKKRREKFYNMGEYSK